MNLKTILLCFLFFACQNKETNFGKELTKDDNFWVYYWSYPINSNSISKSPPYGLRFYHNGEIKNLIRTNGKENEFPNFENAHKNEYYWKYNDSNKTLSFFDYKFKIVRFIKDTIVVSELKSEKLSCFINFK